MTKLHFNTAAEFEKLFKNKTLEITTSIVESIREAGTLKKKSAKVFEISFSSSEMMYEITLPKSQWEVALSSCLKHYEELKMSDDCIDTWQLIDKLKR